MMHPQSLSAADLALPLDFTGDTEGAMVWQYFEGHARVLPMLRGHAARVLGMAGQIMTVDIGELMLLTRADPTSVAELLRMANAPHLFRGGKVAALDEAIIRLGRREVYHVLTTVAARSLFQPQSQQLLRLMPKTFYQVQHDAVVTGLCSAWLAHGLRLSGYEDAFMLGLFGRVGRLGGLFALGHLALADALPLPPEPLAFIDSRPALSTRMSQAMLQHWGLSDTLTAHCLALSEAHVSPVHADKVLHVVRLVHAQQALMDEGDGSPDAPGVVAAEQALQASREGLGLAETQLPVLVRHIEATRAQVQGILGPMPDA